MASRSSSTTLLGALFLLEISLIVMAMMLYRQGDRPFLVFLAAKPGMLFLVTVAVSLICSAVIIWKYIAAKRTQSTHFRLVVTMNLVTVLLILMMAEATIRIASRSSHEGETFMNTVLLPKSWEKVSLHHRNVLDQTSDYVHVYDELMGWTNAPNRQIADGMYSTSSEGIRAPYAGMSFAELPGKPRIALVGDSFTFAHEVTYQDSWGHLLEKALGSEFQVLNFGVGGYGVDQAYLRYEKDVRKWEPTIVIFGLISHDLNRSMTVYPFLSFSNWGPFSSPRFVLRDGDLKLINVPAVHPQAIFSRRSISELPFLEVDSGYRPSDWQRGLYQFSYLARLFVSQFARWSEIHPDVSDEALVSVNASILKAFVRSAARAGTIPIVVYFPHRELKEGTSRTRSLQPMHERVLQEAGIDYTDLTACLLDLPAAERFVSSEGHYSPQANAKVATCLRDVVQEAIALLGPRILNSSRSTQRDVGGDFQRTSRNEFHRVHNEIRKELRSGEEFAVRSFAQKEVMQPEEKVAGKSVLDQ